MEEVNQCCNWLTSNCDQYCEGCKDYTEKLTGTCQTCYWTQPHIFDGTCPVVGEVSGPFVYNQHECHVPICSYTHMGWCFYAAIYCNGKEKQDHKRCVYAVQN